MKSYNLRWHNHLNPEIRKDAWTTEEEQALINAHRIYGNKWAEIAKVLPGRYVYKAYFPRNFLLSLVHRARSKSRCPRSLSALLQFSLFDFCFKFYFQLLIYLCDGLKLFNIGWLFVNQNYELCYYFEKTHFTSPSQCFVCCFFQD
jgi:hypothetical protein